MVRHYNYIFYYYNKPIAISASVTDKMEEREGHKPSVACNIITNAIRSYANDPYMKAAMPKNLVPVSKGETIKRSTTFELMDEAKREFFEKAKRRG